MNGPRCRKVLYAAGDVTDALGAIVPPAWTSILVPPHGSAVAAISFLTGIDIVTVDEVPPGFFRLVHHDGCEAKSIGMSDIVSHAKCTIAAEGSVDLTPGRPYRTPAGNPLLPPAP